MLNKIKKELEKHANKERAEVYARFFKTGIGEYGEGDIFLGITVPVQRTIAKKYIDSNFKDIRKLLYSKYHEHRLTALIILVYKYEKADKLNNAVHKQKIIDFYIKHRHRGNNWDLVDCIADKLLGKHLINRDKSILYKLVNSDILWDRRVAIITTLEFIRKNRFEDTLKIAQILLKDKHDLIHKAVGWMLREIGKRDQNLLENFLNIYYKEMPRTMLRYSIEKFNKNKRAVYLKHSHSAL